MNFKQKNPFKYLKCLIINFKTYLLVQEFYKEKEATDYAKVTDIYNVRCIHKH